MMGNFKALEFVLKSLGGGRNPAPPRLRHPFLVVVWYFCHQKYVLPISARKARLFSDKC